MENKGTGNFLIDSGMQEQFATPVSGYKSIVPDNNTKIKSLTKQPEIENKPTTMSQDDFFNIVDNAIASGDFKGQSEEEVYNGMLESVTQGGVTIDGISPITEKEEIKETKEEAGTENTLGSKAKEGLENVIGGAVSNIPSIIGNTFGFLADVVTPEAYEGLGDVFRESGVKDKETLQSILGTNPDSFATKAGEFGSDFATLFIPGGQAKLLTKFPQASEKIASLSKTIEAMAEKAPKTFNTIKSAVQGATDVGKFEAVTEGEVTPTDLAVGAVANPLIGKTIKGIGNITKGVAEKLEVMGLLNPAKLNTVSEQLKTKGIENLSVSEYLLKNKIKGSKSDIVKKLEKLATESKAKVDAGINSVDGTFKNNSVDEMLDYLRSDLADVPGQAENVNRISELFTKSTKGEGLTLTEINEAKRIVDKQLNLFTIAGDVKAGATKEGLANLRGKVQKFIETTADDAGISGIKQFNKNTQVNRTLIDAITKKDSADQARELLTAFAPGGIGAIGGAVQGGEDPFERLQNIVIGAGVGQLAGSTAIKTNLANVINKLSGLQKESLIKFIQTKGATPISAELSNLITEKGAE